MLFNANNVFKEIKHSSATNEPPTNTPLVDVVADVHQ